MTYPNTSWQTNPLLQTVPTAVQGPIQPTTVQGPIQPAAPAQPTTAPVSTVPTSTVVPEPTVGETLQGIKDKALSVQDQLNQMNAAKKGYSAPTLDQNQLANPYANPIDEKAVTKQQMKLFQAEIDATNKVYDQLYNQKVLEGTGRLGSQRAAAARGGLLGSDFGAAQQEQVQSYNTDITNSVQNERTAKIGAIMGKVRTAVADDIAAKRLAKSQDADAYLKYLSSRKETRQANLDTISNSLIQQQLDPSTMTPDELTAIGKEAGISAADIISNYQTSKSKQEAATNEALLKSGKTQAEIDKLKADTANAGFFNLSEGQARYDANGKMVASKAKTYAPDSSGGLGSFSKASIGEAAQALESTRGSDNYANTGVYLDLYNQAISQDVLPQDFLKKFPPDLYINPEDPSLPSYIKQDMQKFDIFNSL